jgi:hypothetical protein
LSCTMALAWGQGDCSVSRKNNNNNKFLKHCNPPFP